MLLDIEYLRKSNSKNTSDTSIPTPTTYHNPKPRSHIPTSPYKKFPKNPLILIWYRNAINFKFKMENTQPKKAKISQL
jgi:hypothetical protein